MVNYVHKFLAVIGCTLVSGLGYVEPLCNFHLRQERLLNAAGGVTLGGAQPHRAQQKPHLAGRPPDRSDATTAPRASLPQWPNKARVAYNFNVISMFGSQGIRLQPCSVRQIAHFSTYPCHKFSASEHRAWLWTVMRLVNKHERVLLQNAQAGR